MPLTPIQSWFFEEEFAEPHYFNQSVLLEVRETLDPALVERSVRALLVHHDALRLRFTRGATGWRQFNAGAEKDDDTPFTQMDFSELPPDTHEGLIEDASRRLQASLKLSSGPLLRVALYHLGAGRAARLLFSVHHLAVDAVSWRILLEDLQTAYGQLSRGEPVRLPTKSTSFKRWAERLTEHAWSEELRREADYWCDLRWEQPTPVPLDFPEGVNSEASAHTARRTRCRTLAAHPLRPPHLRAGRDCARVATPRNAAHADGRAPRRRWRSSKPRSPNPTGASACAAS